MRKRKVFMALLAVVLITASIFLYLHLKLPASVPGRTIRPNAGLGYSPPGETYTPGSGIKNSPHDLSASSTYYPTRRYNPEGETNICIFCHPPHNSSDVSEMMGAGSGEIEKLSDVKDVPLWTRSSSAEDHFIPYSSGPGGHKDSNRRRSADVSQGPGPVSRFCLGCHDGMIGVNRYGSLAAGGVYMSDPYKIGKNRVLSNHHPIGFEYAAVIDNEINQYAIIGGHPIEELLSNGRMECTTCHDVHNRGNSGEKLLWVSDRKSSLCCSCHKKCST